MKHTFTYSTLDDWMDRGAIPFSPDLPGDFNNALDKVITSLGSSLELLGFGEALHGGEDILILRNLIFRRLAEAHGYSAIAVECSFPQARLVNEFVAGRGPASYAEVQDTGFSHGFGRLAANRELVEWMRQYNADNSHNVKLKFYGFDMPAVTAGPANPGLTLNFVLDYLAAADNADSQEHRKRICGLLNQDSDWENPMAWHDPGKSANLTSTLAGLRIETEELISLLRIRAPELTAGSNALQYPEALHYATMARQSLNFFAALARKTDYAGALGVRDRLMADNLAYIVTREQERGKVFAFAHNSHLKHGKASMPIWTDVCSWWPAGAHLGGMFGARYAVIGSAVGVSAANGIGSPEAGTLEARLTALPGTARFIPTQRGAGLPAAEIAALQVRSGSAQNPSYFPLNLHSFTDFDWLAVLNSSACNRSITPA